MYCLYCRWADHASKQFSEYHINSVEIIFENRRVPCDKLSHWCDNRIKISKCSSNDTCRSVKIHRFAGNARLHHCAPGKRNVKTIQPVKPVRLAGALKFTHAAWSLAAKI